MPNLTGQSIGRYQILEQLGEGGMATVYKAYDTRLEREVAVKVLRTDQFIPAQLQMVLQRFEREAKSLAKLSHPNIVNILDYGEHRKMPYLVMEYLPGGTLKQKLGHVIPWQEAVRLLIPVAQGLAYAHQHGIIHRDVKPANILLKESGTPVLTDFGIAKLLENADGQTLTGSGVGIGTPEYMAPEQGMGAKNIDARADIYSLGIVLYEMVTGRKPYIADTPMAVVIKQISDPLPRPTDFAPDLPENVEHILLKALAKQPDDRYPDMNAMLAAMEGLLVEGPTVPVQPAPQVDLQTIEAPAPTLASRTEMAKKKAPVSPRFSPKTLIIAGSLVAILLLAVFGLPWLIQQFPAAPVATTTSSSAFMTIPTSTNTARPPSATLVPSATLTRIHIRTITPTPAPAWVTNFAQPILAYISSRPPDYEDDFEPSSNAWVLMDWCADWRLKFEAGKMNISNCWAEYQGLAFNDYVVEVKASWTKDRAHVGFWFRDPWCSFVVYQGGAEAACNYYQGGLLTGTSIQKEYDFSAASTVHMRLIAKGGRFAFYVNGAPLGYFEEETIRYGQQLKLRAETVGSGDVRGTDMTGAFDDFKIWNITKLEIPPTATPPGSEVSKPTEQAKSQITASPTPACDSFQFLSDITVPDGTALAPNTPFTKTWRIKNVGTCTWNTSYALTFTSGAQMGGENVLPLPISVAPGENIDVSVNLKAPAEAGSFRGFWTLRNASGVIFGPASGAINNLFVDILVVKPTQTPPQP